MRLRQRCEHFNALHSQISAQGINPYFRPIAKTWGTEVEVEGRRLIMIGSNDYLGLSHDPRVMDASARAVYDWGTGPGGSRFLSGNMVLHHQLEERLDNLGRLALGEQILGEEILDDLGFQVSPSMGVPGHYAVERAFVDQ